MATTRLIPLHMRKNRSVLSSISESTDYVENPEKTDGGELISSYECDPVTVDSEFLFSKKQYENITGRSQGDRDVIAYHLRQSFKPGEIDPQIANIIGYELARSFTKGRNAFIVATHIDRKHIHNHIIINSTSLDCKRKFRNFWGSSKAIQRISDRLCLENGLSVIENPKPSKGHYGTWLGDNKPLSQRENLREVIDSILQNCKSFDEFISAIKSAGYEIKQGKYLSFKGGEQQKFIRCKSLGDDYTEQAIIERLEGKRVVTPKPKTKALLIFPPAPQKINMLIDIQEKIQQGKGAGYEHFAKIFNLKEAAKTLIFLQENNMTDYSLLEQKVIQSKTRFNEISDRIKAIDKRLPEINELQKHIGTYTKTLEVYRQYRDSGYDKKFYSTHKDNIVLHKSAKTFFDELGLTKLPTIKTLQGEYAKLYSEKKKLYSEYKPAREKMIQFATAKQNVEQILYPPTANKSQMISL